MLITKFNRLIRNRLLWGAFAVLVSLAFIGFLGPQSGCGGEGDRDRAFGRVFDRAVSPREFHLARFFEMGLREQAAAAPAENRWINERAWSRLAALEVARSMGLQATDGEVAEAIRRDPALTQGGAFDMNRYRMLVQDRLGVSIPVFEAFLREDLTLQKLQRVFESMVWTSPRELRQRLENLTDEFELEYVVISLPDDEDLPVPDEEAVAAYFHAQRETFTVPEQVRVRYVEFPAAGYFADVAEPGEDRMLEYYRRHMGRYSELDEDGESVPLPFAEVTNAIALELRREQALFRARDAATEVVLSLAPDRYGRAESLDAAAAARHLPIHTSDYFSVQGSATGVFALPRLARAAFGLEPGDPERYFSDAVVGSESAYVLAALDRRGPRQPELHEVRESVVARLQEERRLQRAEERLQAIRASLAESLAESRPFGDACAELGLSVQTTQPFTVYAGVTNDFQDIERLLPDIMRLRAGEMTQPLPLDGQAAIAYVARRSPAGAEVSGLLRTDLTAALDRYRAQALFDDWRRALLAEVDSEALRAQMAEGETDHPPPFGAP